MSGVETPQFRMKEKKADIRKQVFYMSRYVQKARAYYDYTKSGLRMFVSMGVCMGV